MTMTPTQITPRNETEILIAWDDGESFAVPYPELRYHCPCAACVDENTGRRMLRREAVRADVRPLGIEPVGRYAIQIRWSDRHATGIYPFDRLREICANQGVKI